MKTLIKTTTRLLIVLLFVSLTNCQNDDIIINEDEKATTQTTPVIRTLSQDNVGEVFNQITQQLKVNKYLKKSREVNALARTSQDTLGITIYTDVIKEVTLGDYTSYTMRMVSPVAADSTSFYNVTLENDNGQTEMYVTKYTPLNSWLNNTSLPYEGSASTMRVNDFTAISPDDGSGTNENYYGLGSLSTPEASPFYPTDCEGIVIITMEEVAYKCGCGDWPWDNCQGCTTFSPQFPGYNQIPYYYCQESDDPLSGTGGNVNDNPYTGGGTNGNTGTGTNPDDSSITVVLGPDEDCELDPLVQPFDINNNCEISFYEGCLMNGNSESACSCAEQGEDLNVCIVSDCLDVTYLPEFLQLSTTDQARVANYLNGNCSSQTQQFAIAAIDALEQGGEVDFLDEIIKDSSFIGSKADCVYELLKSTDNNLFKNVLETFTNGTAKYKLKLFIGGLQNNTNEGETTFNQQTGMMEIRFGIGLMSKSTLEIAATIIHEGIHAELRRIIMNGNNGPNPLSQSHYDYLLSLLDFYENNGSPLFTLTNATHLYMVTLHLQPLAQAVRSLDNNLYSLNHYMWLALEGLEVAAAQSNPPIYTDEEIASFQNLVNIPLNDNQTQECDE